MRSHADGTELEPGFPGPSSLHVRSGRGRGCPRHRSGGRRTNERLVVETIVVGVDGSPASDVAVSWAAARAVPAGARLVLVHCLAQGANRRPGVPGDRDPAARRILTAAADQAAGAGAEHAGAQHEVTLEFSWRTPREELMAAAATADLVVVGTRGVKHARVPFLGSTAKFLADRAPCPVALLPPESTRGRAHGVVAGVDGSPASEAAVDVAATYAAAFGHPLLLLAVVSLESPGVPSRPAEYLHRLERATRQHEALVAAAAARVAHGHPDLAIRTRVIEGPFASEALLRAAEGSALLVVGRRARGTFLSAVLGSTADSLLRNSPIPLLVVPGTVHGDDPAAAGQPVAVGST